MYRREGSMLQLKLNYSQRRGYHFTLPAADRHLAVEHKFIHIQQMSKKTVGCSTEKLSQINSRCRDVIQKILACTTKLIGELVEDLQKKLHVLFQLSESVALLDMLASFATYVRESGSAFVRPTIGESDELVLKASRHPLLERLGEHSAVPNDVFMTPACNTQLITGPNMAGKSTYLRQVALVCLMAHIGCPVPAEEAEIPLLQRVFTRISTSDSLQAGASSFVSEMREASYILHNLRNDAAALVLFDELGRGTSNRDGASLAWAIIEYVQQFPRTVTLFASHYLQLANLHQLYPNIKCLRMSVQPADRRLHFEYKVQMGVATKSQYMTDFLAEVAGIPASVCRLAKELSGRVQFDTVDGSAQRSREEASRNSIAERLLLLKRNSTLSEDDLRLFLLDLQKRLRVEQPGRGAAERCVPRSGAPPRSEQHTESRPRTMREFCSSPAAKSQASILPRLENEAGKGAALVSQGHRDRESLVSGDGQHSRAHSSRPAHPQPQHSADAVRQHPLEIPTTPRAESDNVRMPRRMSLYPSPNAHRQPPLGEVDREAGEIRYVEQHELLPDTEIMSGARCTRDAVPGADEMDVDGDDLSRSSGAHEAVDALSSKDAPCVARSGVSKRDLASALRQFISKSAEVAAAESGTVQHNQPDDDMQLSNENTISLQIAPSSGGPLTEPSQFGATGCSMHVAIGPSVAYSRPQDPSPEPPSSVALALMALASAE